MEDENVETIDQMIEGSEEELANTGIEGEDNPSTETEEGTEESAEETVIPTEEEEDVMNIPDNWDDDTKSVFATFEEKKALLDKIQDPEVKAQLIEFFNTGKKSIFNKVKSLDDGYQGKFKTLGDERSAFDGEKTSFEQDKQMLHGYKNFEAKIDPQDKADILSSYGNVNNYMEFLYNADKSISANPVAFARELLAKGGIGKENIMSIYDGSAENAITAHREKGNIEQTINQKVEEGIRSREIANQVHGFINEVDAEGNSTHPHFAQVESSMASLKTAYPDKNLK